MSVRVRSASARRRNRNASANANRSSQAEQASSCSSNAEDVRQISPFDRRGPTSRSRGTGRRPAGQIGLGAPRVTRRGLVTDSRCNPRDEAPPQSVLAAGQRIAADAVPAAKTPGCRHRQPRRLQWRRNRRPDLPVALSASRWPPETRRWRRWRPALTCRSQHLQCRTATSSLPPLRQSFEALQSQRRHRRYAGSAPEPLGQGGRSSGSISPRSVTPRPCQKRGAGESAVIGKVLSRPHLTPLRP
jgi:hypothetical protein